MRAIAIEGIPINAMIREEALTSVTGFSLQTNSTLSGGFISASGMSPICDAHKTTMMIYVI